MSVFISINILHVSEKMQYDFLHLNGKRASVHDISQWTFSRPREGSSDYTTMFESPRPLPP